MLFWRQASGVGTFELCQSLTKEILDEPYIDGVSISHEILLSSPDYFGLCLLYLHLKQRVPTESTTTLEKILQSIIVDQKPLFTHLDFLQQRSAHVEDKKLRAKYISPILRHVLMAAIDNLGEKLGGITFKSYDAETKMLSFQYTLQKILPAGPPGKILAQAAELLLGAENEGKYRFVAFAIEGR